MKKGGIIKAVIIILLFAVYRLIFSNDRADLQVMHLTGTTMGPIPYSIKYMDEDGRDFQIEVDSVLEYFNNSMSTYIPTSEVSRFNKMDFFEYETDLFYPILEASQEVFSNSKGAFDPTVGPLVNAWGFGPTKQLDMDSARVDSIMSIVGFDKVQFDKSQVTKTKGMYLDFSAIAKGNGIDIVADFLRQKGIEDYMVEIGGEVACKGYSSKDTLWAIGVQRPAMKGGPSELFAKVWIEDRSIATSGNYRNYYEKDGKIIAHTINPFDGFTVSHNLLSASVFAENCTLADGYATACMVLGLEKSMEMINSIDGLDAFFIYSDEDGAYKSWTSDGVKEYIEIVER
ncbi:MAG: FAD:protein FMN transferase [Cyclobacteriaceae bacterium]